MVWGGLRPIPSRVVLDAGAVLSLAYCTASRPDDINAAVLASAYVVTFLTAGFTFRWPLSLPMLPFLLLQGLRRLDIVEEGGKLSISVGIMSGLCVLASAALAVLFPAVELRPVNGRYNVGVVDLHLPVDFTEGRRRKSLLGTESSDDLSVSSSFHGGGSTDGGKSDGGRRGYVTARLLYPTHEKPRRVPYLDPAHAPLLCSELMKFGAPGPLKSLGFMLHTWRLAYIDARRNAQPIGDEDGKGGKKKLPVAVFSHGLSGLSAIYSYQALTVAASGTCVLMVDHTDGSAVMVQRRDGSILAHDVRPMVELYIEEKTEQADYVRLRRGQADHRVEEVLSSLSALLDLNRRDIPDLATAGVSFVDRLDINDVTLMGHSFGAATALSAAVRRPDLVTAVVAHDPAVDWMPDGARRALFPKRKLEGAPGGGYSGGTGGYQDGGGSCDKGGEEDDDNFEHLPPRDDQEEKKDSPPAVSRGRLSLHDIDMLFLYSDQFSKGGWGGIPLIKWMHQRGELGPPDGVSDVGVIAGTKHQEFSDTCMMTPVWLGRGTGLTGERNPLESAEEIGARTLGFVEAVRGRRRAKSL